MKYRFPWPVFNASLAKYLAMNIEQRMTWEQDWDPLYLAWQQQLSCLFTQVFLWGYNHRQIMLSRSFEAPPRKLIVLRAGVWLTQIAHPSEVGLKYIYEASKDMASLTHLLALEIELADRESQKRQAVLALLNE